MAKSNRLRLGDVRRAFRILGDCRDLGRDRAAWSVRAASGLCDGLDAVMTAVSHLGAGLPPRESVRPSRSLFDAGWPNSRDREAWIGLLRGGRIATYATVAAIYQQQGTLIVRSRDQLVGDREWGLSTELNEDRKPLGQAETLIGQLWHPGRSGDHLAVSVNRVVGGRRFDGRERAFLRLFLGEVHALAGSALVIDEGGPFAGMTARARQVFELLLRGDAEKEIAARLGMSVHTVHDYVKGLYRRFGVSSRGELVAYYHGHNRDG